MHLNIIPPGLMLLGDSNRERFVRMKKKPPIFALKLITWINIIAMVAIPIVSRIEGKSLGIRAFYPILMLGCTLAVLYPIIVSLDDRIKKLEGMPDDE